MRAQDLAGLLLVSALPSFAAASPVRRCIALIDAPGMTSFQAEALERETPGALVFEQAVSQGSAVLPSGASLLTSQYLQTHGVAREGHSLSTASITLAEALEKGGYETAAFVVGPALDAKAGFSRGFFVQDFRTSVSSDSLRAALEGASTWIASRKETPFFLYIHVESPVDESLDAVRSLRKSLAGRDCIQALTAANGPEGPLLSERVLHVPLLVWHPALKAGRIGPVVRLVDLAPSLLEWAGLEIPETFQGASFAPLAEGRLSTPRYAFSADGTQAARPTHVSIRGSGWHLIYNKSHGESRLYDLKSDPDEAKDVQEKRPDVALDLTQRLMRHLRETRSSGGRREQLSPELLKELRERGYW